MTTILLIEDQRDMRNNLGTILEMEYYAVLTADNGRKGLALARQHHPQLIICDVMMPEMDGYSVLQSIRQDQSIAHTPFIFFTAKGEKCDLRTGMNLGADDYLTKPVTAMELLAAVQARLRREQHRPASRVLPGFHLFSPTRTDGPDTQRSRGTSLDSAGQGKRGYCSHPRFNGIHRKKTRSAYIHQNGSREPQRSGPSSPGSAASVRSPSP